MVKLNFEIDPNIQFSLDGSIATIALNRPEKLNAITPSMSVSIINLANFCNESNDVRVVILTGLGPKAFCCGSDIKELDTYQSPWAHRMKHDHCDAIAQIHKPTLCAINGYALGGGLELALCCDIRVSTQNALFGAPEIKLGWVGGGGMAVYLNKTVGASRASRLLYTGDSIDANTGLSWGIVDEVFDSQEAMMISVLHLAKTIEERPPIAIQTAKLNMHAAVNMPLDQAVRYERDLRTICFYTDDAREGKAAFKEKRAPYFRGE
ncbi:MULTISPECIES: enoyl-CoA hydratase/isomerase family protein [unclassified Providencia]|uniref:enoyl-CoA hydratase/isomerase family protein n=1 Tax=unclassified Providencia TaxID=2633465 RepID=UPI001B671DF9|nr:enoyl-CoA hydratase/isomerase family protein [Providencia sp.]MBP6083186.1 enoyl-CoA hydratase/isomerase family protein [Providencia sp.]